MAIAVREKPKEKEVGKIIGPSFRDPATMAEEEMTDPDFRRKQLAKEAGLNEEEALTCTKCHHCRR